MNNTEKLKEDNAFDNKSENIKQKTSVNLYSRKYRILKTILMITAWVSFGINFELIGAALEDLKILLNVNYEKIALALIMRSIGGMLITIFAGLLMDKLKNYSEFMFAFGKFLMISCKLMHKVLSIFSILRKFFFFL